MAKMATYLCIRIVIKLLVGVSMAAAASDFPLGVHFGEEYITAAQFATDSESLANGDMPPIELVASVYGNQAYRDYIAGSFAQEGKRELWRGDWYVRDTHGKLVLAPEDTHDHKATKDLFVEALRQLKAEMSANGHEGNYESGAFTLPEHFNQSSKEAATQAMLEADTGIHKPWQMMRYVDASRLAYQLDSCESLGLSAKSCDMDEGPHLVLLLDRNGDRLDLYALDVTTDICHKDYYARIDLSNTDDAREAARRTNKPTSARAAITAALRTMKTSHFYNGGVPRVGIPYESSLVRAVVLSGDAPSASFDILRSALQGAMPETQDKLRDTLDPRLVPAAGAAYRAMSNAKDPTALKDPSHWDHKHVPPGHDEL